MQTVITDVITFALSNFSLTFPVIGVLFVLGELAFARKPHTGAFIVEALMRSYLFWAIGITNLYNFVMHVFFGDVAAQFIGWAQSPFQAEVGFASLGFGVVGIIAVWGGWGMRFAAIVAPSLFLLGAAGGHVYQMVTAHNFAPGNAGIVFWTDIAIPVAGFLLLILDRQHGQPKPVAAA